MGTPVKISATCTTLLSLSPFIAHYGYVYRLFIIIITVASAAAAVVVAVDSYYFLFNLCAHWVCTIYYTNVRYVAHILSFFLRRHPFHRTAKRIKPNTQTLYVLTVCFFLTSLLSYFRASLSCPCLSFSFFLQHRYIGILRVIRVHQSMEVSLTAWPALLYTLCIYLFIFIFVQRRCCTNVFTTNPLVWVPNQTYCTTTAVSQVQCQCWIICSLQSWWMCFVRLAHFVCTMWESCSGWSGTDAKSSALCFFLVHILFSVIIYVTHGDGKVEHIQRKDEWKVNQIE